MKTHELEATMRKNVPAQVEKLYREGWFFPGVTQQLVMTQMPKNYWNHALALLRDFRNEAMPKLARMAPGGDLRSGQVVSDVFANIYPRIMG